MGGRGGGMKGGEVPATEINKLLSQLRRTFHKNWTALTSLFTAAPHPFIDTLKLFYCAVGVPAK
jgi:hypothetical protein